MQHSAGNSLELQCQVSVTTIGCDQAFTWSGSCTSILLSLQFTVLITIETDNIACSAMQTFAAETPAVAICCCGNLLLWQHQDLNKLNCHICSLLMSFFGVVQGLWAG